MGLMVFDIERTGDVAAVVLAFLAHAEDDEIRVVQMIREPRGCDKHCVAIAMTAASRRAVGQLAKGEARSIEQISGVSHRVFSQLPTSAPPSRSAIRSIRRRGRQAQPYRS